MNPWLSIQELYDRLGIVPTTLDRHFRCASLPACSGPCRRRGAPFNTGTWPYIGTDYGAATIKGQQARILFIAMERGGRYDPAKELAFDDTQASFRRATEERSNPHMGGVAEIMVHLIDQPDPQRYPRQFALTNAVKCVEYTERMQSGSTRTMISNCSSHLRTEIGTLRPDLVITQGGHPRETVLRLLQPLRSVAEFADEAGRSEILVGGSCIIVTTPHPARLKSLKWKSGGLPAFLDAAIRKARDEFFAMATAG